MTYKFNSKNGRNFEIDLTKWTIDENSRHCKIIEISEGHILFENKYADRFKIPEHVIRVNKLNIIDNSIDLPEGLYGFYFLKQFREESQSRFNVSYNNYASVIFQNRAMVLNRAEYYLLKPSSLITGFMHVGGINFTLGKLFESFESGSHVYYDEFCGHRKMYLIKMGASPLSGIIFEAIFWSDETNEFVRFDSRSRMNQSKWPNNFGTGAGWALFNTLRGSEITIDRQDKAIANLINEINTMER